MFQVNASKYVRDKDFFVTDQASLDNPKSNAVMFIMQKSVEKAYQLLKVSNCLVFCEESVKLSPEIIEKHAIVYCENARLEYCRFFRDNQIQNLPKKEEFEFINGAYICKGSQIGDDTVVMPGAYICSTAIIGNRCYIGAGVRIVGIVKIGDDCIIRENSVIGADGLSTDRDRDGTAITMPQFGGVVIGNHVEIGALTVIARGAIDNTIINDGCKIDNSCFISHNVQLGKDTFVVGESILFGSSSTGERAYISGNATVRNKATIGKDSFVGMGSVVTKNVPDNTIVYGNPAKSK